MLPWQILVVLLCLHLRLGNAQKDKVGQFCINEYTGSPGICKLSPNCPQAKKQADNAIKITICGYLGAFPIVCCEETGEIQANENSFLDVDVPNGADLFTFPEEIPERDIATLVAEKCKEYSSSLNKQVLVTSLQVDVVPTSVNWTKCDHGGVPLIVGGEVAVDGEFPHMAAIGFKDSAGEIQFNCGGTLISDQFVLSAAHCAISRNGPPVKVRLGVIHIKKNLNTRQDFDIVRIIQHPQYTPAQKYKDIVLFKLDRPVTLTTFVRPACLWTERDVTSKTAIATGWGRMEFSGSTSEKLLKVTLRIFSNQRCQNTYSTNTKGIPRGIVDSMLCAGDLQGGKDTCSGDSGGPLVITKNNNQCVFYLIGITSFGRHCAAPNTPAIYTRVSSYIEWIANNIW